MSSVSRKTTLKEICHEGLGVKSSTAYSNFNTHLSQIDRRKCAKPSAPSLRYYDIDRAKGLAIFLVVVGHVANPSQIGAQEWFLAIRHFIYLFHMPFFMALSGMIFFHTYRPVTSVSAYLSFVKSKARRLMPAFIIFGIITLFGKLIASGFIYVDNVSGGITDGIFAILVTPADSPAGSLWYIYALFAFYIFFPILLLLCRANLLLVFAVCIPIYVISDSPLFLIGTASKFAIFFAAGMFIMKHYALYTEVVAKYRWIFMSLFGLSFGLSFFMPDNFAKIIIGILSVPALHSLVATGPLNNSRLLLRLGEFAFAIYLMNMISIGMVKGLVFSISGQGDYNFSLFFALALTTGLAVPILIKKLVLPRIPILDKITS